MHRIDTPSAGPGGAFTDGDAGTGTEGTELDADWANSVQEEVISVLTAAGITPNKAAVNQLLASINVLIDTRPRPSYTVALVPTAVGRTGVIVYISNESGGAVPAFSDGTNWRRVTDRAVIS